MTRWFLGAATVAAMSAVVGCDSSPHTIATARPVDTESTNKAAVPIAPGKAPEKSDPKAAELIAAAVAAHTGGKPELLQKFKTVRTVREGKVATGGVTSGDQKWEVHAAWPDRVRIRVEVPGADGGTLVWASGTGWRHGAAVGKTPLTPVENEVMRVESTGEWLLLLFPLTEPDLIAAPIEETKVADKPADGVRLWHPRLSDTVLYFDRESKLLVRFTYEGNEAGQKVTKDVRILAHKEVAGVKLPEKTVWKSNGTQIAEWSTTAVEPLGSLDAKLFEEP